MGRKFVDVLEAITAAVPDTNLGEKARLDWIMDDARYKGPELEDTSWEHLSNFVNGLEPSDTSPKWVWEVVSIFADDPSLKR